MAAPCRPLFAPSGGADCNHGWSEAEPVDQAAPNRCCPGGAEEVSGGPNCYPATDMQPRIYSITTLFSVVLLSFGSAISAQEIEWITDYHEGLELAKTSGKPIFLTYRCVP